MIHRILQSKLSDSAKWFPVVTVTGPRQAGKTTLCRATFPNHRYLSLEAPDIRAQALADPRSIIAAGRDGMILDEVQRAPDLLSYLQVAVDEDRTPGRWVLTGSANMALLSGVSQSLAGRTAALNLLPCTADELGGFPNAATELFQALWMGSFPAVFDRSVPPVEWFSDYIATYLERDARSVLNIGDLAAFQTFLRLCAGRVGQLVNLSSLGADCGITHNTARAWLSVLEAGYLVFRVPPYHANAGKRLVKTPKLYFTDTGLVCALLGIHDPSQLESHPLRGAVFENWVVSEVLKHRLHRGLPPGLFFFRDRKGFEVDLLLDVGGPLMALEAKSGQTMPPEYFAPLTRLAGHLNLAELTGLLVYGGRDSRSLGSVSLVPWSELPAELYKNLPR
jgi:uncharacterized protein